MPAAKNLTGQKFGRLTAIKCIGSNKFGKRVWLFICECGKEKTSPQNEVKSGSTSSCGCFRAENARKCGKLTKGAIKHSLSRSPEYTIWKSMRARCNNSSDSDYSSYGGRGIKVCSRWMVGEFDIHPFICFLTDMGQRPSGQRYSIDRIDVNAHYEPSNCRWATDIQQANNRRKRGSSGNILSINTKIA